MNLKHLKQPYVGEDFGKMLKVTFMTNVRKDQTKLRRFRS